ncbi:MAG: hypothetical protein AAB866_01750, partial [Patescibacteria group bacterium]
RRPTQAEKEQREIIKIINKTISEKYDYPKASEKIRERCGRIHQYAKCGDRECLRVWRDARILNHQLHLEHLAHDYRLAQEQARYNENQYQLFLNARSKFENKEDPINDGQDTKARTNEVISRLEKNLSAVGDGNGK